MKLIFKKENLLLKAKKMPIGTISKGRKKIKEGLWVPVKKGAKAGVKKETMYISLKEGLIGNPIGKWKKEVNLKTNFQKTCFQQDTFMVMNIMRNLGKKIELNLKDISAMDLYTKGKEYKSQKFTNTEIKTLKDEIGGIDIYKIKDCLRNSQGLAAYSDKLKYVEGYISTFGIPINHAWLSYNGKIVDVTIRKDWKGSQTDWSNRNIGEVKSEYFGVEIDKKEIQRRMMETKTYDFILNVHRRKDLIEKLRGKK